METSAIALPGGAADHLLEAVARSNGSRPRPSLRPLPFAPVGEALKGARDRPAYLWDGYLAAGCTTVLASEPKAGKTTKVMGLLYALEHGQPFLGRETTQTAALLLSEEPADALAEKRARWHVNHLHVLWRTQARGCTWPQVVEQAVAYCHTNGLGLLVVDTWTAWTQLRGDAENLAGATQEALEPLLHAAASGLAVLIVAHRRKSGGEYGEGVRGSNALTGGVDVVIELERPRGVVASATTRTLRAQSRFASTPAELVYELTDHGFVAVGSSLEAKAKNQRDLVLRTLRGFDSARLEMDGAETNGVLADEVADASGLGSAVVRKKLAELYAAGKVHRTGDGKKGSPYRFGFLSAQLSTKRAETNRPPA